MTWLRRGAASVYDRKFGSLPYSVAFARILLIRDRASANDLEIYFLFFVITSLIR
jgi:hypothetical protein